MLMSGQPHSASQQVDVAHTMSIHCQIKHWIDLLVSAFHCSIYKMEGLCALDCLCNVAMYFFQ